MVTWEFLRSKRKLEIPAWLINQGLDADSYTSFLFVLESLGVKNIDESEYRSMFPLTPRELRVAAQAEKDAARKAARLLRQAEERAEKSAARKAARHAAQAEKNAKRKADRIAAQEAPLAEKAAVRKAARKAEQEEKAAERKAARLAEREEMAKPSQEGLPRSRNKQQPKEEADV